MDYETRAELKSNVINLSVTFESHGRYKINITLRITTLIFKPYFSQ